MNTQELTCWLMLSHAPAVDAKTLYRYLKKISSVEDLFMKPDSFYRQLKCSERIADYLSHPDWSMIEDDLKWVEESANHHILTISSPEFPKCLLEIGDPPLVLYVKGHLEILAAQQLAIVGARKPSPDGREIAYHFAYELAGCGLTITSGLAAGIDAAAHQGALKNGRTIAVLGNGMNRLYPRSNLKLAEEICEVGALVTEFAPSMPPLAINFPRRNRIVSGLSLGSLVIEANLKSGSLITAHYAVMQGREVFAVPGSIHNPLTRGCHYLIQQGAKLVEKTGDVLEELNMAVPMVAASHERDAVQIENTLDDVHRKLLECVGYEPAQIDILIERSNLPLPKVVSIILDLEQAGLVRSLLGGYMRVSNERRYV